MNAVVDEVGETDLLNQGIVIRLSGLLQTDDRLALREITKQLNVDEESSCKFSSFAGISFHIFRVKFFRTFIISF